MAEFHTITTMGVPRWVSPRDGQTAMGYTHRWHIAAPSGLDVG